MIKLYQFPISHYCEKVRWTLDYKKLDYQCVNLLPGLHIKHTKKIAKYSSVPVLTDQGKVIQNSDEILTYLDEQYPERPLTPSDPVLKQQALDWETYLDKDLGVHVRCVCYHILLDHPEVVIPFFTHKGPWYGRLFMLLGFKKLQSKMRYFMKINEETAIESEKIMAKSIDKIYLQLQSGSFLVGDQFTRADLSAAALLAPLCQPEGYGLQWPDKTPDRLQQISDKYRDKLNWVYDIYKQYRNP